MSENLNDEQGQEAQAAGSELKAMVGRHKIWEEFHINVSFSRWLLGIAWDWGMSEPDPAVFIHFGPICMGFHRPDYYETD